MLIIGYGSLMNKDEFSAHQPRRVVVKGWKRIFARPSQRQAWQEHEKHKAVLTIVEDEESSFNAIMYEVNDDQMEYLVDRETFYDQVEVRVFDFETGEDLGLATVFVSRLLAEGILPIVTYFNICREGAYSWGDDFGKAYDQSTYLADGSLIEPKLL